MSDRRFTSRKTPGSVLVAQTADRGQVGFAELGPRALVCLAEESGPDAARFIRIRAMVATWPGYRRAQ